ncbi:MAG: aminotransferase class V-fold PLP-dependent enzyme [Planctomycetota bacterium]|nr:aminotransferase class V-fold PLP-dependent enzyme [Planctomycetota bacterium]MDA1212955.1 aminotransferase class V-fold PLP-dependent enzyme [Planctomycetota bacterium]
MTIYLDCNATTPIDPRVLAEVHRCFVEEIGNAGSPHEYGLRAKQIVHTARDQIARIIAAKRNEIIFTSGATEANNLAILGLFDHGVASGKRHIVSTQIEHKAVLEPLSYMKNRGFDVTLVPPASNGRVNADAILDAVRPDTLLVSMMHVNNETGVIQPVADVAEGLASPDLFLHIDAAQGFGKDLDPLRHPRIDLMSISSHKIFGPVGIGALFVRRRRDRDIPLTPLMHGGGQELGLRPGTLPVPLISGFGLAAELSAAEADARRVACQNIREQIIAGLSPLQPIYHGDEAVSLPHVISVSFSGIDADEVIELLTGVAAVSTGSACTSVCATSSHVLSAMGVAQPELDGAVRISWSHRTESSELQTSIPQFVDRLSRMMSPQ